MRRLSIHVGSSKTGTSALQFALWASVPMLQRAGIGIPFPGRKAHVQALLRPLGWEMGVGFTRDVRRGRFKSLADDLRSVPGDRLLISNEDLAELDEGRISLIAEAAAAADLELEVILSARDWSRQLPSEWQQFLKHRLSTPYPTFLEEVRDRSDTHGSRHFWQRQDFADISHRWGTAVPPERLHVVVVGSQSTDPDGVYRAFGSLLGFDPSRLKLPRHNVNASFGYTEAEVFRRLNEALGHRLPHYSKEYLPAVRSPLVRGALARQASTRIPLPSDHVGWVREEGTRQLAEMRSRGYTFHGDPDALVAPEDSGRPLPELDEAEVAAASIDTLANFAVQLFQKP